MKTTEELNIAKILSTAASYKASDLHLSVGNPPILRVDGKLVPLNDEEVMTPDRIQNIVLSFLDSDQQQKLEKDKEILLAYSFQDKVRFRVNAFFQKGYLSASLRFIDSQIKSLKELRLPVLTEKFTKLKKGLVLVCGPAGSGRTTTLASLINTINKNRSEYILTIEKPIEYLFINDKSTVEQREVGRDVVSFEQALKSVTQKDVNIVAVSELDTPETVDLILDAAGSGQLCFAVVSADTVLKAVEKIHNMFLEKDQKRIRAELADNIEGVICQRLLPRIGGGRMAVAEIMVPSQAVRTVIREGGFYQLNNIIQTSREEGMVSLDRSLAELVKTNEILLDVAVANATDPEGLKMRTRGIR